MHVRFWPQRGHFFREMEFRFLYYIIEDIERRSWWLYIWWHNCRARAHWRWLAETTRLSRLVYFPYFVGGYQRRGSSSDPPVRITAGLLGEQILGRCWLIRAASYVTLAGLSLASSGHCRPTWRPFSLDYTWVPDLISPRSIWRPYLALIYVTQCTPAISGCECE